MEPMEFVVFIVVMSLGYSLISKFMQYYFKSKRVETRIGSEENEGNISRVFQQAEQMEQRIEMLETILDKDLPGWRKRI